MSQRPTTRNETAIELASRLNSTLGVRPFLIEKTPVGWRIAENQTGEGTDASLETLDLVTDGFETRKYAAFFVQHDSRVIVAVNATFRSKTPCIVAVVLDDQTPALICSLVDATAEALRYRDQLEDANQQTEQYIDQVTQDFEELTWLRKANEYFDLCDASSTIESIASTCLPGLSDVIVAETIFFVLPTSDSTPETARPDPNRFFATNGPAIEPSIVFDFLKKVLPEVSRGPVVANEKFTSTCLDGFPGLRNCIAIELSKDHQTYGWLLAINKRNTCSLESTSARSLNQTQSASFGTFEAGLLGAAASIMASHARNRELFEAQEMLLTGVVRAIINAIDAKDPYTCGHSDRVASYAKSIAARMGANTEECERIYMAGLLHDVGKIGIPDSILGKPGKLTDEEYAVIKKHPEIGHTILQHLKQLDYVLPGVLYHHEAVNGSGYPMGLIGEMIPLAGRILAVADAYDAMTSDRPYRTGMPSEKAESILRAESGKMWDSDIVSVFLECLANDDIKRQTTPHAVMKAAKSQDENTGESLMRRIATSISSMANG